MLYRAKSLLQLILNSLEGIAQSSPLSNALTKKDTQQLMALYRKPILVHLFRLAFITNLTLDPAIGD